MSDKESTAIKFDEIKKEMQDLLVKIAAARGGLKSERNRRKADETSLNISRSIDRLDEMVL